MDNNYFTKYPTYIEVPDGYWCMSSTINVCEEDNGNSSD